MSEEKNAVVEETKEDFIEVLDEAINDENTELDASSQELELMKKHGLIDDATEKKEEEEKKEEIVEAMVEKELGLENWCGECKWANMGFNCDKRVSWMMDTYHITEVAAKEANIEQCVKKRRKEMLRYRV